MEKYTRKKLNLARLLALGELDVRAIASSDSPPTADGYFSSVERFIENAAALSEPLLRLTGISQEESALIRLGEKLGAEDALLDASRYDHRLGGLDKLKDALTEIGYEKINPYIDSIRAALCAGEKERAEKLASKAFSTLSALCGRLGGTYIKRRFSAADDGVDEAAVSLSEALARLDYEEENRRLRILAVDDISVVLNTLTSLLSPHYEIFALKSGAQVEKFLTHTTPELFLLDIEMNEMSGFDLVPVIRKFDEHKDTPIIFLTGNASGGNLRDAVALGACDFITKPVNPSVLLEKIGKSIVRKKLF